MPRSALGVIVIELPQPYLIFLGDETQAPFAKTAFGLRDWVPELCVGECALPAATVTTGLPRLTPAEGRARGQEANRAKAFSRVGMGRCQGRFCAHAGAEVIAAAASVPLASVGRLRGQAPVKPLPVTLVEQEEASE